MPFWATAYLALFVLLSIGAFIDDVQDHQPLSQLVLALLSHISGFLLVLACWNAPLAQNLGGPAVVLIALMVSWDGWSGFQLARRVERDPVIGGTEAALIEATGVHVMQLLRVPAYLCGLGALRHLL